eukprot:bmy_05023T0
MAVLFPVEHSWLAPRGSWNTQHLCSFTFLKEPMHYCCSLDPQNPQDDKKWCYPAHAWALEPGLLQVFLALRICCILEPLHTLTQESALEG